VFCLPLISSGCEIEILGMEQAAQRIYVKIEVNTREAENFNQRLRYDRYSNLQGDGWDLLFSFVVTVALPILMCYWTLTVTVLLSDRNKLNCEYHWVFQQ
jgi:hypothetical protein